MPTKKYDAVILPGRYEPMHLGHVENGNAALSLGDNVLFLAGSINQPRTIKNPFLYNERKEMINAIFPQSNVVVKGVEDYLYNDKMWTTNVRRIVNEHLKTLGLDPETAKVAILGHEKDESSYYLKLFNTWKFEDTGGFIKNAGHVIDATKIRELYFEHHIGFIESVMHPTTYQYLLDFYDTEAYKDLVEEYNFIKKYKALWKAAPYPVTFNTVDACVVQGDYILLIQRKDAPGKGLWALPGGYLNAGSKFEDGPSTFVRERAETFAEGCLRELWEETRLKVPERTLQNIIARAYQKCFDHPGRSLRGRTITQAFLIELEDVNGLPKVTPKSDAMAVKWFTLDEVRKMSPVLFEDHYSIITHMLGKLD